MYTNVAEAGDLSDARTVTVCGAAEVTADGSATVAYNRAWTWTIDGPPVRHGLRPHHRHGDRRLHGDGHPTVHDTGATVTGSITVHNPNNVDLEMTVSDAMLGKDCLITTSDLVARRTMTWSSATYLHARHGAHRRRDEHGDRVVVQRPSTSRLAISPTKDVDFGAVIPTVTSGGSITVFGRGRGLDRTTRPSSTRRNRARAESGST